MRLVDADKVIQMENGDAVDYLINAELEYDVEEVVAQVSDYLIPIVGRNSRLYKKVIEIIRSGGRE